MERKKLSDEEIEKSLNKLDGWKVEGKNLKKRFEFKNFAEALNFVNKVGEKAEERDHHPDINLGWGYAEFSITTHDRNGITAFDFAVAKEIDAI
jgi:4a-hydroxytetrahydrobiopterin dehydratase